ncbi:glycosyltransferase family 87 protein [Granulicoccus sp. GXG6511]|uniref:glycosyltransferase family 87 protein n=1 Tax=Granulicoccus sp. GXG6511 TaxID=3381351 RepID=UPI003D7D9616
MSAVKRVALVVLYAIPPLFAALYAGATEIADGQFTPWRPVMIDLDVYIRTAELVLQGQDFYNVEGAWLPWLYTPFAALLAIPFAFMGTIGAQIFWLLVNGLMVMAIVYRLGFKGWRLSLVATAAIWLVEPMRVTLGFGQVNLFLMALVVFDLMPGERVLGNRKPLLPQGWLTGIAAAIKLTPALFAVYLFLSGRVKTAIVTFVSFVVATVIGFIVLPGPSINYWGRLIGGDSGLNTGMKYYTNQSIIGSYIRFSQENPDSIPLGGLVLAMLVIVIGVFAAVLWHRLGHMGFAVGLAAITALLASPISWSHHFVWIVPLAVVLITDKKLPDLLRFVGLGFSLWVVYAPFMQFKDGEDEFLYPVSKKLIDAGSVILGLVFFAVAIGYGLHARRARGLPWLPLTLRENERPVAQSEQSTPS